MFCFAPNACVECVKQDLHDGHVKNFLSQKCLSPLQEPAAMFSEEYQVSAKRLYCFVIGSK